MCASVSIELGTERLREGGVVLTKLVLPRDLLQCFRDQFNTWFRVLSVMEGSFKAGFNGFFLFLFC